MLKLDHVGRLPTIAPRFKAPPPLPHRPASVDVRRRTTADRPSRSTESPKEQRLGNEPVAAGDDGLVPRRMAADLKGTEVSRNGPPGLPPRLPLRGSSTRPSPQPPPRKRSERYVKRRNSLESVSSAMSNESGRWAASGDVRASTLSTPSSTNGDSNVRDGSVHKPNLASSFSTRPSESGTASSSGSLEESIRRTSRSRLPPPLPMRPNHSRGVEQMPRQASLGKPKPSALSFGLNPVSANAPALPGNKPVMAPRSVTDQGVSMLPRRGTPELIGSGEHRVRTAGLTDGPTTQQCLKCRDFSEPDQHATRYPRSSVISYSPETLSHLLTEPFSSRTDKARVIFTWLHNNIAYDVESFFNDAVKPATPSSVMTSGLAVCQGYASLFSDLATHAGLESVVICGHGKGYGFTPMSGPKAAIPPYRAGHAWNAVRLDAGHWQLIDCCWGAGAVDGKGQPYIKRFAPSFFTSNNDDFGRRHFPEDPAYFFRSDGRTLTWAEYITTDAASAEPPQMFSGVEEEHRLNELSFRPAHKRIPLPSSSSSSSSSSPASKDAPDDGDGTIRFEFCKICPHWNYQTMGKGQGPYCYILAVHGDGSSSGSDHLPFESDDHRWWCDVPLHRLGSSAGQTITCFAVTSVSGHDDVGAFTSKDFLAAKGRKAMAFSGVAAWELTSSV